MSHQDALEPLCPLSGITIEFQYITLLPCLSGCKKGLDTSTTAATVPGLARVFFRSQQGWARETQWSTSLGNPLEASFNFCGNQILTQHASCQWRRKKLGYGTFMPCESMLVLHSYWGFNGFVDFTTLLLIFASIYGWKTIQLTSSVVSVGQWELAKSRRVNALCEKTLRECHQT